MDPLSYDKRNILKLVVETILIVGAVNWYVTSRLHRSEYGEVHDGIHALLGLVDLPQEFVFFVQNVVWMIVGYAAVARVAMMFTKLKSKTE